MHQVPVQLWWQDTPSLPRRQAPVRRWLHPRRRRRQIHLFLRAAGEAEGAVRVGRHSEPPVPASDRGPRRPGLCHLRRRPRRPRRGVRHREPRPAFPSQDPSLPPPPPPKPVPPSLRTDCVRHVSVHAARDLRLHGHGSPRASNRVVRHVSRLLPLSSGEEGRTHQAVGCRYQIQLQWCMRTGVGEHK
ncbi:PB1 domain containing protein [Musa troglodytarum]|uniref:PB1 domain containing protein n=1 Tax=Musa troglodytarum TaxID=320322 RepID=A0A9E7KQ91_9LILI|nr:PB1 domain containing protein [Musa troglodytarum]